ncbi:MAG: ATP synthase F1 subunit gamma [bacterium]|nr:ATP synthase F1 subunit gamma [bacterium]
MANTRQIKRRITASQNISKITKAMEMVAASKMKRAQDQALAARPYSRALEQSLQKLASNTDHSLHPLLSTHGNGIDIAVLFSTDKGLCGSLNTNLLKAALQWQKLHPNGEFVVIGRKAVAFCRIFGLPIHAQFTELPEVIGPKDMLSVSTLLMDQFLQQKFKSVHLIYMDFVNTLSQQLRSIQLLPLTQNENYQGDTVQFTTTTAEYTFEPNAKAILGDLLPYYVENAIYQTMLEAKASEHSARMVAMKNASENAAELVEELRLIYNKTRQASITNELLDITTALLTLS